MILNSREIADYESVRIRIRPDNTFNTLNKTTFETLRTFTNGTQIKKGVCHECDEISTLIELERPMKCRNYHKCNAETPRIWSCSGSVLNHYYC